MTNRSGMFKGWMFPLFFVFLAVPLIAWSALPGSADGRTPSGGDAENGRDLFMGRHHLEGGGPPCMGCHNVGENGLLGGGAMGPDLTNVSSRRSDAEILGLLSNTGAFTSPVMRPIYADAPLSEQEQADLLAFLRSSAGQPESDKEWLVFGISLGGFAAAVAALGFVYRGRLRGVRKSLLRQAQK